MADAAIGVVIDAALKTVISLAAEKISLVRGMKKEMEKLTKKLEMVQALLIDAHQQPMGNQSVQLWLKKLRSVSLDAQIVLEELDYEVLRQKMEARKCDRVRAFFSSSNPLLFRQEMAQKIKQILQLIEEVYAEANSIGLRPIELGNFQLNLKEVRYTAPYIEDSKIVGRKDDLKEVVDMLTIAKYENDLPVIAIVGMGGQGKTTLAQLVYNDEKVKSSFHRTMWVCVSEDFDVKRLLDEMLQCLIGRSSQLTSIQALVDKLKEALSGKRYLLVLDDVWNSDVGKWNLTRACFLQIGDPKGSKILATTRNLDVASTMETSKYHHLGELLEEQSWELFEKYAFAEGGAIKTQQLENIGRKILKRCGGLPLAIKTIGSLLHSKKSESEWLLVERSELWSSYSGGDRVFATIKLSYDHLPILALKQCFAHCAIFQKDTLLEESQLIQLWMAQGLLNPSNNQTDLQMEDIGSIYFDILVRSSLFQEATNYRSDITTCKMHDLVHDFALQVSRDYCHHVKDWKTITNKIDAVHISIHAGGTGMLNRLKCFLPSNLRTLYLKGKKIDLSEEFLQNFTCLSVLIVEDEEASELPNSVGKMKHLRFIDIWHTSITKLPRSFKKLYSLQTLRIENFEEVPMGFGSLINLRHIHMRFLEVLPRLYSLRNLQTFPEFRQNRWSGHIIEELEHLDNLKGKLTIDSLDNVKNYESSARSKLSKKLGIHTLELEWNPWLEEGSEENKVMEGLEPHPGLKALRIKGYKSSQFPSWIEKGNHFAPPITNLVKLELRDLVKCERLPVLGRLPCLEHLTLFSLDNVECIKKEFYGLSDVKLPKQRSKNNGGSNSSEIITLFPRLITLNVNFMKNLVEWSDAVGIIQEPDSSMSSSVQITAFPCLKELHIYSLPKLNAFPNLGRLPSLENFSIGGCHTASISSGYWHDSLNDIVGSFFPSLHRLRVSGCNKLSAPICSLLSSSKQLKSLEIKGCTSSWPKDLHHLISLKELRLETGDEQEQEIDCIPWPYPNITKNPVPITSLILWGYDLPNVKHLPYEIQYLDCLMYLEIRGFEGLEILPEWLGNLKSPYRLKLAYCSNIKQLPSAEALQRVTHLTIWGCGALLDRLSGKNDSEWHKIAHIPHEIP